MLNFPLASYIEAGEFTKEQLDAIDARIAAGKAVPGQPGEGTGNRAVNSAQGLSVQKKEAGAWWWTYELGQPA